MTSASARAPRRRRRRWPIVLVVVVVVVALLAVGVEFAGRTVATGYARDRIASALGVGASGVSVDLDGRPLLLDVLDGHVQTVTATARGVGLGGLTGDINVVARDVGLSDRRAGAVRATVAIPNQSGLTAALSKQVAVDSVAFSGDRAVVSTTLGALGAASERLAVSASGGRLVFTPESVTIGGTQFDVAAVRRSPFASSLSAFTSTQTQCIDSSLPQGLHLEQATLAGSTLNLLVTGARVNLATTAKGSCG